MKALPTVYKGVQYRSMLEARYAAWFDLMRIPVLYEPEAFAGYIPDFMSVRAPYRRRDGSGVEFWTHDPYVAERVEPRAEILFEVKGALEKFDLEKIRRSGWLGAVVCLDAQGPVAANRRYRDIEEQSGDGSGVGSLAHMLYLFWSPGVSSHDGESVWEDDMDAKWREAGNLVQWRSPRNRPGRT